MAGAEDGGSENSLSALIVNYNTAALTRDCVTSLRAQQLSRADGTPVELEIIVVDNASRPDERAKLHGLDATVLFCEDNRGYGAALNTASKHARGEFLLFSNPDTWYFPNALQTLTATWASLPHCGAVGPRLWWDRAREFLLPPSDPVTLSIHLQEALTQTSSWWGQRWQSHWLRNAVQYWQCRRAFVQAMLSGACILTHRDVLANCGGFDERFHLYYEDTDWCRRVRQHGYSLYYVPTAEVAHFYNQSARQESATSQRKFADSAVHYFQKHYGIRRWQFVSAVATAIRARPHPLPAVSEYQSLGPLTEPPQLSLPTLEAGDYLFLLSPVSSCTPAIARFASAPQLLLSSAVWQQLGEGEFFARLVALSDLRVLKQWHWEKRQGG
jgi:GT2 family glycosyltransferase